MWRHKMIGNSMKFIVSVWLLAAMSPAWAAGAGKILFANGNVKIINAAGQERPAKRGEPLDAGDTIVTSANSTLQARLEDGGVIAVRPDTRLKIEEFSYKNKDPKQDKALLSLSKGAFRSITGAIAEQNKDAYRINTPSASIGIRGTDHEPMVIPVALPGEKQIGSPGTYDKVNSGSTILQTAAGNIQIRPNQVGFAGGRNLAPTLLPQIPSFYRATSTPAAPVAKPAGGTTPAAPVNPPPADTAAGSAPEANPLPPDSAPPPPPPGSAPPPPPGSAPPPPPPSSAPPPVMGPAPIDGTLLSSTTLMPPPTTTTAPPTTTSTLIGGTPAPIGSGGAGADTWMGPFGIDSGSGSIVIDGSPSRSVLVGPKNEMILVNDANATGGFKFTANSAPLAQAGSFVDPVSGMSVFWGRWAPGFTVVDQGLIKPSIGSFHYIYSSALTPATTLSLLASSSFTGTYNFAGGTSPTDHAGNAGIINSASMTANFGTGQITIYTLDLSIAGKNWIIGGSGSIADFTRTSSSSGATGIPLSCTGSCGTLDPMSRAYGQFIGPKADGVLSSFNLKAGAATATGTLFLK